MRVRRRRLLLALAVLAAVAIVAAALIQWTPAGPRAASSALPTPSLGDPGSSPSTSLAPSLSATAGLSSADGGASSSSPSASPSSGEPLDVTISSVSEFARCALPGSGRTYTNAEVEPFLAINAADPANLFAVWQQDRSSTGGARAIVTAVSRDGGRKWRRTPSPFGDCVTGTPPTGGIGYERVSDPWISCGPHGSCFQTALGVAEDGRSSVLLSRSVDGGRTWSGAQALSEEGSRDGFDDKESITADPLDGNLVYSVWDRTVSPGQRGNPRRGPDPPDEIVFTRSTDGGFVWDVPRVIGKAAGTPLGNQIVVLPDGTLLDVFEATRQGRSGSVDSEERVILSADKGVTWSRPITIATVRGARVRDPGTGQSVRSGEALPAVAADPRSGRVYVAWTDERFSNGADTDIALSESRDGGHTWSSPRRANQTPRGASTFTPTLAVASDGTVGVGYYDFRNDTRAETLLADRFLATSSDGTSWRESRLTDVSFDLATAPNAGGFFLGDYAGQAATGDRFVTAFAVANGSSSDPTRVVLRTVP